MSLGEVMAARAATARGTKTVEVATLGAVEVEALAPRDLAALDRRGERAVLYAACRALQRAGDELFRAGQVYRPEEVTALLTDEEASALAREVRALSGFGRSSREDAALGAGSLGQSSREDAAPGAGSLGRSSREDAAPEATGGEVSARGEVRPNFVRGADAFDKFRHRFVQAEGAENGAERAAEDAPPPVREGADEKPQNVVVSPRKGAAEVALLPGNGGFPTGKMLEQMAGKTGVFGSSGAEVLHETKSESGENLHEIKSESGDGLHEIKSEFAVRAPSVAGAVTEETAEEFARALLGGLRRAAWVR